MKAILAVPSETIKQIKEVTRLPVYIKRAMPAHVDTLIRWGTTKPGATADRVYNRPEAIKIASDKGYCRQFLHSKGIPVPRIGDDIYPCIGRPRHHTKGNEFWFCQTPFEVALAKSKGAEYFSQFYPKTNEYRVHIGGGKVLLYSEKVGDKFGTVIWNHDLSGFEFVHIPRGERRKDIIDLAKQVIEAIGLDFGAIDILADPFLPGFPKAVICEVNTAPRLESYGREKYSEYFSNL